MTGQTFVSSRPGTYTVFGPGSTGSAVAVTHPEGETTVRISVGIGRTVMSIDAEGNTVVMEYDETIDPAAFTGIPTATPIPGDLLATSMTDPNGNTPTTYTDGAGRTLNSDMRNNNRSAAEPERSGDSRRQMDEVKIH